MNNNWIKKYAPIGFQKLVFNDKKEKQSLLLEDDTGIGEYGSNGELRAVSPDQSNHCHGDSDSNEVNTSARRKLTIASILCLVFMIGEIVGGALAHSLAIMTDAAHLLTDFASFMISLLAIYLSSKPATKRMSFGWHRAEVVGALASVLLIWVITGILVYLAVLRIINGHYEINGEIMLITSVVGIIINILMAATLHHGHSHDLTSGNMEENPSNVGRENINVRAAFIHVIGDLVQSMGVFIAALLIYLKPQYKIADPICTFIFSFLVLLTTISIIRDTMVVLMEGTPSNVNFNEVKAALCNISGVVTIHNLRIWSLTMNRSALSVHIAIDANGDGQRILRDANNILKQKFLIADITIQLENYVNEMSHCLECEGPRN